MNETRYPLGMSCMRLNTSSHHANGEYAGNALLLTYAAKPTLQATLQAAGCIMIDFSGRTKTTNLLFNPLEQPRVLLFSSPRPWLIAVYQLIDIAPVSLVFSNRQKHRGRQSELLETLQRQVRLVPSTARPSNPLIVS